MLAFLLFAASKGWPSGHQIALRYTEYLGYFLIYGALGFQWLCHRSRAGVSETPKGGLIAGMYETALRRAAMMGILGAVVLAAELCITGAEKVAKSGAFIRKTPLKKACPLLFCGVKPLA